MGDFENKNKIIVLATIWRWYILFSLHIRDAHVRTTNKKSRITFCMVRKIYISYLCNVETICVSCFKTNNLKICSMIDTKDFLMTWVKSIPRTVLSWMVPQEWYQMKKKRICHHKHHRKIQNHRTNTILIKKKCLYSACQLQLWKEKKTTDK